MYGLGADLPSESDYGQYIASGHSFFEPVCPYLSSEKSDDSSDNDDDRDMERGDEPVS